MQIEEEIEILESALRGALLVPSECAFVNTRIIKICLDTLRTYESWEDLIRYEVEKQIKAETLDLLKGIILDLERHNHYDARNELMYQSVKVDDVIEVIEEMKEKKE